MHCTGVRDSSTGNKSTVATVTRKLGVATPIFSGNRRGYYTESTTTRILPPETLWRGASPQSLNEEVPNVSTRTVGKTGPADRSCPPSLVSYSLIW